MNTSTPDHIPEDVLEQYAMGRLSEPDSAPLEEHMLLCPTCQDSLERIDKYVAAAQAAAALLRNRPGAPDLVLSSIPAAQSPASLAISMIASTFLILIVPGIFC